MPIIPYRVRVGFTTTQIQAHFKRFAGFGCRDNPVCCFLTPQSLSRSRITESHPSDFLLPSSTNCLTSLFMTSGHFKITCKCATPSELQDELQIQVADRAFKRFIFFICFVGYVHCRLNILFSATFLYALYINKSADAVILDLQCHFLENFLISQTELSAA